jgi:hypothetical protein
VGAGSPPSRRAAEGAQAASRPVDERQGVLAVDGKTLGVARRAEGAQSKPISVSEHGHRLA